MDRRGNETRSSFASTTGGVMTEEVGAVTGDLEVATRPKEGAVEVVLRYVGADEWYVIEGSPIKLGKAGGLCPWDLRELHERIARHLTTPGTIVAGNEEPVSLRVSSP